MTKLAGVALLLIVMGCGERTPPRAAHADGATPPTTGTEAGVDRLNTSARAFSFSLERIDQPGTVTIPSGRVSLVIFTGSWSLGSKRALHILADIHRRFAELEVIAISMDETAEEGRSFAQSCAMTFPIGHDPWGRKVAGAWGQGPYSPNQVFLLDRDGVVRYVGRGGKDGWYPDVAGKIPVEVEKLLATR